MRSPLVPALVWLALMLVLVGAAMSAAAQRGPESSPVYIVGGASK